MIPADVASRLQNQATADVAVRPAAPVKEVSDRLSDLVAGQRVMAEIQAALPNGTYRALINQRDVTLALPFSARSGDALELLVTESDGKKALAVVAHREASSGRFSGESVSTTLSRTGQFIAQLLGEGRETPGRATALPLNAGKPVASAPPLDAPDIAPSLKQAISESGMFYESHLARWVDGGLPTEALLREPQGKLASASALPAGDRTDAAAAGRAPSSTEAETALFAGKGVGTTHGGDQPVAPQTQAIVQQQLEALATHHFAWQGFVWPGQEMRWEIDEDAQGPAPDDGESAERWRTRLSLRLPTLGQIDARIELRGDRLLLAIDVDNAQAKNLMRAQIESLRQRLLDAGLIVASVGVDETAAEPNASDGHDGAR